MPPPMILRFAMKLVVVLSFVVILLAIFAITVWARHDNHL